MDKLRQFDTVLRFVTKSDKNSEFFDVASNRCCALFHLVVSLSMNVSLIVLNNSIIGMPSHELQKLISWLKRYDEVDNKQIIVVQRSTSNSLQTDGFHLIHCSTDDILTVSSH